MRGLWWDDHTRVWNGIDPLWYLECWYPINNLPDCCQCEIDGMSFSFWNAEAKTFLCVIPTKLSIFWRKSGEGWGSALAPNQLCCHKLPGCPLIFHPRPINSKRLFCQHPIMPHFFQWWDFFQENDELEFKRWQSSHFISSLFKSKVIEVFVGLDNVKGQRVRFELRPPPNCTELSQQYLPGEGL